MYRLNAVIFLYCNEKATVQPCFGLCWLGFIYMLLQRIRSSVMIPSFSWRISVFFSPQTRMTQWFSVTLVMYERDETVVLGHEFSADWWHHNLTSHTDIAHVCRVMSQACHGGVMHQGFNRALSTHCRIAVLLGALFNNKVLDLLRSLIKMAKGLQ